MHMTTVPTATIGFKETPITTVKPTRCRNIDSNTLIHSVIHTYHPERTEPTNVHCQNMQQLNNSFELNHSDLNNYSTFNKTACNVHPYK